MTTPTMRISAVPGIPLIEAGDDVGRLIVDALEALDPPIADRDVVAVSAKIVSKSEGLVILLSDIEPSLEAEMLARSCGSDPRWCQAVLDESAQVIRVVDGTIVAVDRRGMVAASAGVDWSNAGLDEPAAVRLPPDPDASAASIRRAIRQRFDCDVAVVITDSSDRFDRDGAVAVAIGVAGLSGIEEHERKDLYARARYPREALADEIASAAAIVMGDSDEGTPVVVLSGVPYTPTEQGTIRDLLVQADELKRGWRF